MKEETSIAETTAGRMLIYEILPKHQKIGLEIINKGAPTKGKDKRPCIDSGIDTGNILCTANILNHSLDLLDF